LTQNPLNIQKKSIVIKTHVLDDTMIKRMSSIMVYHFG
jgi:hypothetical protein